VFPCLRGGTKPFRHILYKINKEKAIEALIRAFLERGGLPSGPDEIEEGEVYIEVRERGKGMSFRTKHNAISIY